MKVFVVIGGWNYEGYDDPVGVYSTIELAEAAVTQANAPGNFSHYDRTEIMEYIIDITGEVK